MVQANKEIVPKLIYNDISMLMVSMADSSRTPGLTFVFRDFMIAHCDTLL